MSPLHVTCSSEAVVPDQRRGRKSSTQPEASRSPIALVRRSCSCATSSASSAPTSGSSRNRHRAHAVDELRARVGEDDPSHAPVGRVDLAFDEAELLETVDDPSDVRRVVAQARRELALRHRGAEPEQRHRLRHRDPTGGDAHVGVLFEQPEQREQGFDHPVRESSGGAAVLRAEVGHRSMISSTIDRRVIPPAPARS